MRLPNADHAVVDIDKLRDYCLSKMHPRGRDKARVFEAALGLTVKDADVLRDFLLVAARSSDKAHPGKRDFRGQRFRLDLPVTWQGRYATVRSAWIVRSEEGFPRLTTCFVL